MSKRLMTNKEMKMNENKSESRMVTLRYVDPRTGEEVRVAPCNLFSPRASLLWQQSAEYEHGVVTWLDYDSRAVW